MNNLLRKVADADHLYSVLDELREKKKILEIQIAALGRLHAEPFRIRELDNTSSSIDEISAKIDKIEAEISSDANFYKARSIKDVVAAYHEIHDKLWYIGHLELKEDVENGTHIVSDEIWAGALESAQRIREKYGEENLTVNDDFEYGLLCGKLSTLNWLSGYDWDLLDT